MARIRFRAYPKILSGARETLTKKTNPETINPITPWFRTIKNKRRQTNFAQFLLSASPDGLLPELLFTSYILFIGWLRRAKRKRGKSPTRNLPPAPRATEPAKPPLFLNDYTDEGEGEVTQIDGFTPVSMGIFGEGFHMTGVVHVFFTGTGSNMVLRKTYLVQRSSHFFLTFCRPIQRQSYDSGVLFKMWSCESRFRHMKKPWVIFLKIRATLSCLQPSENYWVKSP